MPFRIAPQSPVLGYDDVQPLFDRLAQQAEFNNQYKRDSLAQQDALTRLELDYRQTQANKPQLFQLPGGNVVRVPRQNGSGEPAYAAPTAAPWTPTVADRTEARAGGYDYFYDGQQWVLRPLHNATGGGGGGATGGNPMASPGPPQGTQLNGPGGADYSMAAPLSAEDYARNLNLIEKLGSAMNPPAGVKALPYVAAHSNELAAAQNYYGNLNNAAFAPSPPPGPILVNGVPLPHYGAGGGATTNGLTIRRIR